ncbi:hypothetical protein Pmani_001165 [Petrolisthes manimaculis]|uniref:Uncharacterized protein n=1 Tax=Petrolisthes manimaculis TaxID=1843537 RepID=A0AAE1QNB1_9EUCA|nr:hypothetical protein Pmani_001165 [Petrolisthes manimaculis]
MVSSAYCAVSALNNGNGPYGEKRKVQKAECINHVAKRPGTGLRGLKMPEKAKNLEGLPKTSLCFQKNGGLRHCNCNVYIQYKVGYIGSNFTDLLGIEYTVSMDKYLKAKDASMDTPFIRKSRNKKVRRDLEYAAGAF